MPLAETSAWPHWLAATAITVLLWWTIASPLLVLGAAVLAVRRPRLRALLVIAVCAPPLLVLLPLTVMRGGLGAVVAGAAAALELTAVALELVALVTHRAPAAVAAGAPHDSAGWEAAAGGGEPSDEPPLTRSAKLGWAGAFSAVAGGMVGSLAFLTLFS